MSIMINLLPDLRQAKLRQRRRRQLALGVSFLVWAICGGSLVVMFLYSAGQKVLISTRTSAINDKKEQLKQVDGLMDALTAQQHLASLPQLYSQRVLFSEFFKAYSQADPVDVTLESLTVDERNVLTVNGVGRSFAAVAKLARALEASNVTLGDDAAKTNMPYFSDVAISNTINTPGKGIVFNMTATVSPEVLSGK
jgi:Tfp pilus assembly protein PilN